LIEMESSSDFFWVWFLFWLIYLLFTGSLILLHVYAIVSLGDLESDYLNPIDFCSRLNKFVIPEYAVQGILSVLLLLTGNYLDFLVNFIMLSYNGYQLYARKHLLDPTTIFNRLSHEKYKGIFKLIFYMATFFLYLYRFIHLCVSEMIGEDFQRAVLSSYMV